MSQLLIVSSLKQPSLNLALIDRLLLLAAYTGLTSILAFNKVDLVKDDEAILKQAEIYAKLGYSTCFTSAKQGIGLDKLQLLLKEQITVLAGPSGVGKSSLLNTLQPELSLQTGSVSDKAQIGKHTTRHVQLIPLDYGGFVADTPGFSRLDLPKDLRREDLTYYFPEMEKLHGLCKFNTCLHKQEPGCKIKQAVQDGVIEEWRYNNYLVFLNEVIAKERSY